MTEVQIRHAQFTYFEEIGSKVNKRTGEDVPDLATRHAKYGEIVDISRDEDYQRGVAHGAFEDVVAEEQTEEAQEEPEPETVPLDWERHDDLVEWIRDDKPTAKEVVSAAEGDPEKAQKLMDAENEASGSQPRKAVMDPLRKIIGES